MSVGAFAGRGWFEATILDFFRGMRDLRDSLPEDDERRNVFENLFGLGDRLEAMRFLRAHLEESIPAFRRKRFQSWESFFKMLIENLPAIIDAIMKILAMFP